MNASKTQIGASIRYERESQGFSQGRVAQAAGISRNGLALIERGSNPTINTLIAIAKALGLRLEIKMVRDE